MANPSGAEIHTAWHNETFDAAPDDKLVGLLSRLETECGTSNDGTIRVFGRLLLFAAPSHRYHNANHANTIRIGRFQQACFSTQNDPIARAFLHGHIVDDVVHGFHAIHRFAGPPQGASIKSFAPKTYESISQHWQWKALRKIDNVQLWSKSFEEEQIKVF